MWPQHLLCQCAFVHSCFSVLNIVLLPLFPCFNNTVIILPVNCFFIIALSLDHQPTRQATSALCLPLIKERGDRTTEGGRQQVQPQVWNSSSGLKWITQLRCWRGKHRIAPKEYPHSGPGCGKAPTECCRAVPAWYLATQIGYRAVPRDTVSGPGEGDNMVGAWGSGQSYQLDLSQHFRKETQKLGICSCRCREAFSIARKSVLFVFPITWGGKC